MSVYSYIMRLEDTLRSRQDITIDEVNVTLTAIGASFEADIHFINGSRLSMAEEIIGVSRWKVERISYKFHYQQADGTLCFRYDNSPHYPNLSTFPDHKHVGNSVIESDPPDLSDVLQEIYAMIYPSSD